MKYKLKKISTINFKIIIVVLGLLGLLPLIFGLIDLWINNKNLLFGINITKSFGVIILSFLGAVYWGFIINTKVSANLSNKFKVVTLLWSVLPSIVGIFVLATEKAFSILMLICGFLMCHIADEIYNKLLLFPKGYILLRRILSFIVINILILSLFIAEG